MSREPFDNRRDREHEISRDAFDDVVDLYLTGDLAPRRRARVRDEILNDREAYEKFRRARECHGILDDHCEYLRSRSESRRSRVERVLDEVCDIGPAATNRNGGGRDRRNGGHGRRHRARRTEVLVGAAIVLVAVVCVATAFVMRAQRFEERILARVSDVEGQVRVSGVRGSGSGGSSRRVADGYGVRSGDVLESGPGGSLVLELSDGGSARMGGDGRYALRSGGDARELRIDYGKVFVRGVTGDDGFRVATEAGEIEPSSRVPIMRADRGQGGNTRSDDEGAIDEPTFVEFEVDVDAPTGQGDEAGGEGGESSSRSEIRLVVRSGGVIVRPVDGRRELVGAGAFDFRSSGISRIERTRVIDAETADASDAAPETSGTRGAKPNETSEAGVSAPVAAIETYNVAARPDAIGEAIDTWVDEAVELSAIENDALALEAVLFRARTLTLRREAIVAAVRELSARDVRSVFLEGRREAQRAARRRKVDEEEDDRVALARALRHGVLVDVMSLDRGNAVWGDTLIDLLDTFDGSYEDAPILGTGLASVADRAALAHFEAASRGVEHRLRMRGLLAWAVLRTEKRRGWYPAALGTLVARLHQGDPARFPTSWVVPLLPFMDESVAANIVAGDIEAGRLDPESAVADLALLLSTQRDSHDRLEWDELESFYADEETCDVVQAYLAGRFVRGLGPVRGLSLGRGSSFGTCISVSVGSASLGEIARARREAWLIGKMTSHPESTRAWSRERERARKSPSRTAVWDDIIHTFLSGNVDFPQWNALASRSKSAGREDLMSRLEAEVESFCKEYLTQDTVAAAETCVEYVVLGDRDGFARPCRLPSPWFDVGVEVVVAEAAVSAQRVRKAFLEWVLWPPEAFAYRGWWECFGQ